MQFPAVLRDAVAVPRDVRVRVRVTTSVTTLTRRVNVSV
jgi:hypothetical protein